MLTEKKTNKISSGGNPVAAKFTVFRAAQIKNRELRRKRSKNKRNEPTSTSAVPRCVTLVGEQSSSIMIVTFIK